MTSPPLSISIIIPTLCEASRIGALLQALLAQQYDGEIEIIVVDGGSEDGTSDVVRAQSRAKVLWLEASRGVSRQRNAGAQRATGDLLIFMDADDVPSTKFVRDISASYKRCPFAVACPWFVARENVAVRVAYLGFNLLFWLGQSTLRMGSGVCIITRRDVFERVGGFDEELHLGEDIHYIRRAARHGWHRHLLIPLQTSGRRYQTQGFWKLTAFYARITPPLLLGLWPLLRDVPYEAAPYKSDGKR